MLPEEAVKALPKWRPNSRIAEKIGIVDGEFLFLISSIPGSINSFIEANYRCQSYPPILLKGSNFWPGIEATLDNFGSCLSEYVCKLETDLWSWLSLR